MQFIPYVFGAILVVVGIRAIVTREARISIQPWGSSADMPNDESGYVTAHSGLIAILIGIGEVAFGLSVLLKGPAFFQ